MTTSADNPAEVLREAASLMRSRAEGARGARWSHADSGVVVSGYVAPVKDDPDSYYCGVTIAEADDYEGVDRAAVNAEHIAALDPAVALALADWLDAIAARIKEIHESLPFSARLTLSSLNVTAAEQALTLARTYLRSDR